MIQRFLIIASLLIAPAIAKSPAVTDPAKADSDYAIQGEYEGVVDYEGGIKVGIQVIAQGKGEFAAAAYAGGLPGSSAEVELLERTAGKLKDGKVTFEGAEASGVYENGKIRIMADGEEYGVLKKMDRKSKTLGKKPPEGAVVLFAGKEKDLENWKEGKIDEGSLVQGTTSNRKFGDHHLHIEFRLPYSPEARGQGRGNSGLYMQGRYEVQMLDSFGLKGENNECGGIYSIKAPDVNMCYPPLTWQTYDIDFTAAKYDGEKVVEKPKMTVRHNGVVVHKDVPLPKSTTASPMKPGPDPGPIYLQNHGNPVRYRNIWVLEK